MTTQEKEQERRKARYWQNRKQAIKDTQRWYQANKKQVAVRCKLWREKNKDRLRKVKRDYYLLHREEIKARSASWSRRNRDKRRIQYHQTKEQHRQQRAEYRRRKREHLRTHDRAWRYGISGEHFNAMLKAQDHKCAICRRPEKATYKGVVRNLCIDHDHSNNMVRGLLCSACNTSIGKFEDNPDFILAALEYVLTHRLGNHV